MSIIIVFALVVAGVWIFIKILPTLLRFLLYFVCSIPVLIFLLIFVPGFLDEAVLLLGLLLFAIAKAAGSGSSSRWTSSASSGYSGSYSNTGSYVLNKKTGVIHDRWDSSVDTISDNHRRSLSYSEAHALVNRGTRYRFKQDP